MKTRFTHFIFRSLLTAAIILFPLLGIEAQTTHDVNVASNAFSPDVITIAVGDEVTWNNTEGFHNVNGTTGAYPDNPESFGNSTGNGWTFSHTFNTPGVYDYHCDPHVSLGMAGQVIVEAPPSVLTINFSGMNPHVGQDIWVRLEEAASGDEIFRGSDVVETSFSMVIPGIEAGNDYIVEMYADHNGNGYYDAPGDDHAWQLELNGVDGDEVIDFVHNTDFTDIEWKHRLRVRFDGMNPHIGQMLKLYVRDQSTGATLDSVIVATIENADFDIASYILEGGGSYHVDFYADLNENGVYDAPPADHAWRLEVSNAMGDVDLDFSHNTTFTDIMDTGSTYSAPAYAEKGIKVYPNPAAGVVTVASETIIRSAEILSVSGAVLRSYSGINALQRTISLDEFSAGVYFLKVRTGQAEDAVVRILKR